MIEVRSAAVYARISQDSSGEGLGVQRQLEDCRKLAADRGWVIGDEYIDNDISAFSGKVRPAYERMLTDIESGARDAVIVYHQDRLTRRPMEFEQFAELCQTASMNQFASVTSDIQLSNDDGLFTARVLAAVAAKESSRKSARTKRRILQKAEAGLPNGGNRRPFGYERDRMTLVESEAVVIREIVERFLARESMTSIVQWVIDSAIPTVDGGVWRTITLRQIITNARIAGWRMHNGERIARAQWPAIVDVDAFERVLAEDHRRKATGWRPARRHLLSGLLRCGRCGNRLYSTTRNGGRRVYVCAKGNDHGGCGKLSVSAAPVEEWIAEAVLLRLDGPEVDSAITGEALANERYSVLLIELQTAQSKMDELILMWAQDELSREELRVGRAPLELRVKSAERQLAQIAGQHRLDGLAGNGQALREEWIGLNLSRQAAIVSAVLEFATIQPSPPRHTVDPGRIVPTWRL